MGKAKGKDLTDKQKRFVEEYLIDLNATQAAIRAGYSEKTACEQGARLLANVKVQEMLAKSKAERAERTNVTKDYVVRILCRQYEINAKTYPKLDFSGDPVIGEDGKPVMRQVDPAAANKAAELLGRHVGAFEADNKSELTGGLAFVWTKGKEK